ncbi:alpha-2,8-sialyltransferase 8F-like isoform X1, partial [Clarias magur]
MLWHYFCHRDADTSNQHTIKLNAAKSKDLASINNMLTNYSSKWIKQEQNIKTYRCNLPPLTNGYEKDTGSKTNLVTANPSILFRKYHSLIKSNQKSTFVKDMELYGDALVLLPAFSLLRNTGVSLRALHSLQDLSKRGPHAVFFNPRHSALKHPHNINQTPAKSRDAAAIEVHSVKENPIKSKENTFIDKLLARYSTSWKKQEQNFEKYRSLLGSSCKAISNAMLTQSNSPLGSNITYDAFRKKIIQVKEDLFSLLPKESPFQNAPWDSCAVVGNGGILANSSCGKQIDSASYVIRCNLPPLNNGYERDTGSKTNLVTANPSILFQ